MNKKHRALRQYQTGSVLEEKPIEKVEPDKPVKKKKVKEESKLKLLLEAFKFIKPCQKKNGTIKQQYCFIDNGFMTASNDILTIGTPVPLDIKACPHTITLEEALKSASEDISIIKNKENSVSLISNSIEVSVRCVLEEDLTSTPPDIQVIDANNNIKQAFKHLHPIATDGATEAVYASILLTKNSAVATNGHLLTEYYHGVDIPSDILIPKIAAKAIGATKKELIKIGCSGPSATFWFEDCSFIKTQLYREKYSEYESLFEGAIYNHTKTPKDFFDAVKSISTFNEYGFVYINEGKLLSNDKDCLVSKFDMNELSTNMNFNSKHLLAVKKNADYVHFYEEGNRAFFFSENIRSVVMGLTE